MINKLKPKSEFSRNILTLMTGTIIVQSIPIAISPILTWILLAKFKYIEKFNERRREIAKFYNENIKKYDIILPLETPNSNNSKHVYYQYTIRSKNRDELQKKLKEKDITSMVYYPIPLHKMRIFKDSLIFDNLNNSEIATKEVLSLPIESLMEKEEIEDIVKGVRYV